MTKAEFSKLARKGSGNSGARMFLTRWTGMKRDRKTGLRKKARRTSRKPPKP